MSPDMADDGWSFIEDLPAVKRGIGMLIFPSFGWDPKGTKNSHVNLVSHSCLLAFQSFLSSQTILLVYQH